LEDFGDPLRRPDFVLSNQDGTIEIVEIKKPNYGFSNTDMDRLDRYVTQMGNFLSEPAHKAFTVAFTNFHVTLVCDRIDLTGIHQTAFDGLISRNKLTHISWMVFLARAKKMHQDFMNEAERQKRDVAKGFQ
jgi:hypothetical protein